MAVQPDHAPQTARHGNSKAPEERRFAMAEALFWALLVLVALAPLPLGGNRPWGWGALGIGIGAVLVLFAVEAYFDPNVMRLGWRRYRAAMVAFVLVILWMVIQQSALTPAAWHDPLWQQASTVLGTRLRGTMTLAPAVARQDLLHFLIYGGIFFLAIHFGRSARRARLILWSLAAAGAAYAAYGLIMFLGRFDAILWYRKWTYQGMLTSTFVNHNSFATYAGITLIATLALFITESENSLRFGLGSRSGILHFVDHAGLGIYLLASAAVAIAAALLLSQSRGGFVSTAIGLVVFALALRFAQRRRGAASGVPLLGVALGVAGIILISFVGSNLLGRFADMASNDNGRQMFYALTLEQIGQHPLTGTGLGSFQALFEMIRDERLDNLPYNVNLAHNSYLEDALELGLPMFLVLLATLAGLAAVCVRGLAQRRRDWIFPAAGVAATALVAFHSSIDFSLQIPGVSAAYALLLGAAYAQSFPTSPQPPPGARAR